jgi:hypothetical protein
MTAARALAALTEAFEEAGRLNRSALLQLREGGDLGALEALFLAKQALSEELEALLPHLEGARQDPGLQEALAKALAAQTETARSEVQLSEVLGKIVSSRGKLTDAYQQKLSQMPGKGWEVAG